MQCLRPKHCAAGRDGHGAVVVVVVVVVVAAAAFVVDMQAAAAVATDVDLVYWPSVGMDDAVVAVAAVVDFVANTALVSTVARWRD